MYHSQHRPKSNRISQLFRCDFPAMRLHGGFDDGQANSDSLHRARVRFIHGTFTPRGSHAALPIACDAFNARTMAIREYHCPACTVVARKLPRLLCGAVLFALLFPYGEKRSWRTRRPARYRKNVSDLALCCVAIILRRFLCQGANGADLRQAERGRFALLFCLKG